MLMIAPVRWKGCMTDGVTQQKLRKIHNGTKATGQTIAPPEVFAMTPSRLNRRLRGTKINPSAVIAHSHAKRRQRQWGEYVVMTDLPFTRCRWCKCRSQDGTKSRRTSVDARDRGRNPASVLSWAAQCHPLFRDAEQLCGSLERV